MLLQSVVPAAGDCQSLRATDQLERIAQPCCDSFACT